MDKRIPLYLVILAVVGAFSAGAFLKLPPPPPAVEAPEPVEAPSIDPDGPEAKSGLIRLTSHAPGDFVSSPLVIAGEARGNWYFEASFPVRLLDGDGKEIALGIAAAQDGWMTTEFVPFVATLEFEAPATASGTLVLEKDNPSGLPQFDGALRVPVRFNSGIVPPPAEEIGCRRTGCSGQVCAERDVATTCEFREIYACYREAACERQPDGGCGWTPSPELTRCLEAAAR